ncbi:MAG: thioredoxin [Lachnospiraceae bacterium]|jgi:thioredoxin 1|nr:thioredoxin [Lachnospiraceae bacterium]
MAEIILTSDNFEAEVLKSDVPVLVDFWASWCGPCKMLGPVISRIAEASDGSYKVGKVDTEEEMELAVQYGIMSIPAVFLFKGGEVVDKSIGYDGGTEKRLIEMLNQHK